MKNLLIHSKQKGFTTVELMIAISVFSVIILMTTVVITGIGNTFNRGINQARTQNSVRMVADSVAQQIKNNSQVLQQSSGSVGAYCIGNVKYSYVTGHLIGDSVDGMTGTVQQVLWKTNNATADCTPESIVGTLAVIGGEELVPRNTRLNEFSVTTPCDSGCIIKVNETFGTDDYVENGGTCKQDAGPYCTKASIETFVTKRL
jgi:prepilin-type N-terminal cleavage/methylation domain-containing protein